MASSIFPDVDSAGGIVFRYPDGVCLLPLPNIQNTICPPVTFKSTCDLTALPSDCTARIEARQINAIVSELVSFAACIDPTGLWDCGSLQNLCSAFEAWATINIAGIIISDTPPVAARDNMLWWESDSGNLYVHYNDGNTTQWVQLNNTPVMDGVSIVGSGVPANPHSVGIVDCGVW